MFKARIKAATIHMIDHRRGDLFAVISSDAHYVVQVESALYGSDATAGAFVPGLVGIGEDGKPVLISLQPASHSFTPCKALDCTTVCGSCGGVMRPADELFICTECGDILK